MVQAISPSLTEPELESTQELMNKMIETILNSCLKFIIPLVRVEGLPLDTLAVKVEDCPCIIPVLPEIVIFGRDGGRTSFGRFDYGRVKKRPLTY